MASAAILFLMDSSQKFIISSGIPREQPYQIWMQSNLRFKSYRAHKLFRRPSSKMAAYGLVPKKYMGWIVQAHRSCLWKISKIHQLTFSKSWISYRPHARPIARPPASGAHYIPHSLIWLRGKKRASLYNFIAFYDSNQRLHSNITE